jgi:hypothetical protein
MLSSQTMVFWPNYNYFLVKPSFFLVNVLLFEIIDRGFLETLVLTVLQDN